MSVIAKYRFKGKDLGLLAIAFPQVRVLKGPLFYEFIPDKRVIVVSEDDPFTRYPKKEVIQIISSAPIALDTRLGFLRALSSQGVKPPTQGQVRLLLDYTDDEFWECVKIATVLRAFPGDLIPKEGLGKDKFAMLDLFANLFFDFPKVWRAYWRLRRLLSTKAIFCRVVDMMQKSRDRNYARTVKPYYRRLLEQNQRYFPLFVMALDSYCQTQRDDGELLALFSMCSAHTRPPTWGDINDPCLGWNLKLLLKLKAEPEAIEKAFRERFPHTL
jgi:hypothetical protein